METKSQWFTVLNYLSLPERCSSVVSACRGQGMATDHSDPADMRRTDSTDLLLLVDVVAVNSCTLWGWDNAKPWEISPQS